MATILTCLLMFQSQPTTWSYRFDDITKVTAAVLTEDRHVFVLSQQDSTVYHLDANGHLQGRFGQKGSGPGEFGAVFRMQYLPQTQELYLTDGFKNAIQVFNRDGTYLRAIPVLQSQLRGCLFPGNRLIFYNPALNPAKPDMGMTVYAQTLDQPSNSSKDWQKLIHFDAKSHADGIPAPGRSGFFLRFPWTPRLLHAASPDGKAFYVTSNMTVDVHVIDAQSGRVLKQIEAESSRHPLEKAEISAHLKARSRQIQASYTPSQFQNPDYKPALRRIAVDRLGRLWGKRHNACGDEQTHYGVFEAGTGLVRDIVLPPQSTVVDADQTHVWYFRFDEATETWTIQKSAYPKDSAQ